MSTSFDAIIIGTGQAGPSLAGRLTKAGWNVAILERARFGGTCVNTGCIPTKAMVASAYAAHIARRAADYGVRINGAVSVDMKQVKARKDAIAGKSEHGIEQMLKDMPRCTVIEGHARFTGSHQIEVNGQTLSAPNIFINVGGRAAVPPVAGIETIPYLTNSTMMDVDFLPPHLLVLGGSYIGLEFGQMFRRFGSQVTIVERGPHLIGREDSSTSDAVQDVLAAEGITTHTSTKLTRLRQTGNSLAADLELGDGTHAVEASHLLAATGRRPNTDDLGLEQAAIATDAKGYILVDNQLRTNVDGIWALGDCNGRGAFTHTSYNDFEIVAANILDNDSRRVTDRITAYNLYIDPPLGRIGMTESEARKSGREVLVGERPMSKIGRAVEKGETQGFVKILVDAKSKHILGATILGTGADEVIHVLLDVMYARAPYTVVQRAVHIHPTVSELLPTILGDLKPLDAHQPAEQGAHA